mmetsp:Transcript_27030/g.64573  ORF Transcript_27030/g.64573 Transcript_27030/m.64573 type:complete len:704 (-) Transcript_27030:245-2356(-)
MNNTTSNNRAMGYASTSTSSVIDYFSQSTQSMYWIFDDEETLLSCRQEALNESDATTTTSPSSSPSSSSSSSLPQHKRTRKFASGYQRRQNMQQQQQYQGQQVEEQSSQTSSSSPSLISPSDQETIVHFHAHQLQQLVGPNAMFEQLRRSSQVLSTAIVLLRRFYLSNSVVDFHPRHIASAAALLAVKTDCEPNLPIELLSHATIAVHMKQQHNPLCRHELCPVSVDEIEEAERALLEGCDFRLRCHHPYKAIQMLSSDIIQHMMIMSGKDHNMNHNNSISSMSDFGGDFTPSSPSSPSSRPHPISPCASPRSDFTEESSAFSSPLLQYPRSWDTLCERALSIAQAALVYSDAPFLSTPNHMAVAAVSLALDGSDENTKLGKQMESYLDAKFQDRVSSPRSELEEFKAAVNKILTHLESCPSLDLIKYSGKTTTASGESSQCRRDRECREQEQATKVRQSFAMVAQLRTANHSAFVPLQNNRRYHYRESHGSVPASRYHRHHRYNSSSSYYHQGYDYHSGRYHHQHHGESQSQFYGPNSRYNKRRFHHHSHSHSYHYDHQRCGVPPPPHRPSRVSTSVYNYKTLEPATSYNEPFASEQRRQQQQPYHHTRNMSGSYDVSVNRNNTKMNACGLKRIRESNDMIDDLSSIFDFDNLTTDTTDSTSAMEQPLQELQQQQLDYSEQQDHDGRRVKIARVTPITVPFV